MLFLKNKNKTVMKIKFKENGEDRELDVNKVIVIDRDGIPFRITQDFEKGIDVLADTLGGTFCVEPHTSNNVTLAVK
jgi:hypothetical protein